MKTRDEIDRCVAKLKTWCQVTPIEKALIEPWIGGGLRKNITEYDWADFGAEVEALNPDQVGLDTPASSLPRLAAIYRSDEIWDHWAGHRAQQHKEAAEAAWIASTVQVLTRHPQAKGTMRESRIRPEHLHQWVRPGYVVAEHQTSTVDRRSDEEISMGWGKLNYRAYNNGSEIEFGTVKDMRIIGDRTQYLIRPRSKAAESRYCAALMRIEGLEHAHHDAMMADLYETAHGISDQIRAVRSEEHMPSTYLGPLTRIDYDALHVLEAR